jgi:HlyD family type I secretion membrane fusion protein
MHLVDVLRLDARLDHEAVGLRHDQHDWLARINDAADRVHGELVHEATLRGADLDALELVLRRHLALDELADLALDVAQLGRHLALEVLVELDDLQLGLGDLTLRGGDRGDELALLAVEAQAAAKRKQTALINQELEGVDRLYKQNLVPITRLTSLQREASRLDGEEGQLVASIAASKGKIAETELQIIQLVQDLKREVAAELRDSQAKIGELVERKVAAEDQLRRVDIRAPQNGFVHQLAVHTIGGVINAGEPIMLIVPQADSLVVEARIAPQDIDQVHPGQQVTLRFSAFSQRTTPEIFATVSRVSADLTREAQTNTSYYTLRVTIPDHELKKLDGKALIPGMPVEAFIQTGSRTALSYLVKPFEDQVARAFRER